MCISDLNISPSAVLVECVSFFFLFLFFKFYKLLTCSIFPPCLFEMHVQEVNSFLLFISAAVRLHRNWIIMRCFVSLFFYLFCLMLSFFLLSNCGHFCVFNVCTTSSQWLILCTRKNLYRHESNFTWLLVLQWISGLSLGERSAFHMVTSLMRPTTFMLASCCIF